MINFNDHLPTILLSFYSPSALHTILHVLDRNNVFLGKRFQEIYQNLQAAQELDELNDSNSFLTLAINSAVKTLEHSEVGFFPEITVKLEGKTFQLYVITSKCP